MDCIACIPCSKSVSLSSLSLPPPLIRSPEAQLDYVASLRPPSVSVATWEERVNNVVWTASYMKTITSR